MKITCIFILFSLVLSAQDRQMRTEDFLINAVLENTANYFGNKDQERIIPFRMNLHKEDSLEWDKSLLSKWQIVLPKDSLK